MLERITADTSAVIYRLLVWVALILSALVFASFVMFAHDQAAAGSQHQQSEIVGTTTAAPTALHHAQPRRFIDGVATALTSPFKSLVHSTNPWALKGVPTILGLLVYGVGLGFLARYSRGIS